MANSANEYHAVYAEYSRTLRTWFVAYGVGGPVVILAQDKVASLVINSGYGWRIAAFFSTGVLLQILLALINKYAAYANYAGEADADYRDRWWFTFGAWISRQFLIDLVIDVLTAACFIYSTIAVLDVLIAPTMSVAR